MRPRVEAASKARSCRTVLTVADVARYLRIRKSTVYKLLKERRLTALKVVGSDWRFRLRDIDSWRLKMQRDWNDAAKRVDCAEP